MVITHRSLRPVSSMALRTGREFAVLTYTALQSRIGSAESPTVWLYACSKTSCASMTPTMLQPGAVDASEASESRHLLRMIDRSQIARDDQQSRQADG